MNHFTCTKNHLVRANRAGRMFRRSSSAFLLQSNHCMLITPDAHLLKLCQDSSSGGDLPASLGITIVIKCTPVSNLSLLQCSYINLSQADRDLCSSILCCRRLSLPRSGHGLFVMQAVGTCRSSHSLQTPGDSTPTVTCFLGP